ncbi:MAG: alpha/beta hydrolase fold domain-containing protein, partial [Verrucomicrobiales bacterium]|nr:alpha/beta hydrolase fold domain-containing protein [Verrucomicrobiales bacterium]
MRFLRNAGFLFLCLGCLLSAHWSAAAREPDVVLPLWTGSPPGESQARGAEHRVEGRPRPFYQLTDVTTPTLSVFLPPEASRNGTLVLVCPGGGLQRVAWEHEGLEVADWLNSRGIAAAVLKYRVPSPARTAAMDVQRAMRRIRSHAAAWKVDPDSVGFLGFSAGGELGVWLLTHSDERLYPEGDAEDAASCRPDFVALAYSGGLLQRDGTLKEPLGGRIRPGLPPVFVTHAFDDSSQESLVLALALKRAGVPTEVHVFREGGHGFGVRNTGIPTGSWKDRYSEWLGSLGYLDRAGLREQARRVAVAWESGRTPPRMSEFIPDATVSDAYAVQHRWVRRHAAVDPVAGFKAAAATASAQAALGIDGPLAGVLFRSGRLEASSRPVIPLREGEPIVVETEVGYLTSVDLSYEILN